MNQYKLDLEGFEEDIHVDQAPNNGPVGSFYTEHGLQHIECDYIFFIKNINVEVKQLYRIDRRTDSIGISYKTYYDEIGLDIVGGFSHGLRIEMENGETRDVRDVYPKFDSKNKKIDAEALMIELTNDIHLHIKIKENLLLNLDNYVKNQY